MSCPEPDVLVIGAGIAGASTAWTLAERGWRVCVIEAQHPGHGGSGNPAALLYPKLVKAQDLTGNLHAFAYLQTLKTLQDRRLSACFKQTGVLWLNQQPEQPPVIDENHPWWQQYVWPVDAQQASQYAQIEIRHDGYWLPQAGVINPKALLQTLLAHPNIELRTGHTVLSVHDDGERWHADNDHYRLSARYLVIANAGDAHQLAPCKELPIHPVRGQVSSIPYDGELKVALAYGGYIVPSEVGELCLGATFQRGRTDCSPTVEDQVANRQALAEWLPALADTLPDIKHWKARASLRWQSPDYLPLVGALNLVELKQQLSTQSWARHPHIPDIPQQHRLQVSLAHGSKGFSQAWVAADIIANNMEGKPQAELDGLSQALRADRFLLRQWRRGQLNAKGND